MCRSVLQCVTVCCSVLQCVTVWCHVLQIGVSVALCWSVCCKRGAETVRIPVAVCCSVCCSATVCCKGIISRNVSQCLKVQARRRDSLNTCCGMLQYVLQCCSVLQWKPGAWLNHMRGWVTDLNDSCTCTKRLMHVCGTPRIYMRHNSPKCGMTHLYHTHELLPSEAQIHHHMNESCHANGCVMSHIWTRIIHTRQMIESCDTHVTSVMWHTCEYQSYHAHVNMSHVTHMGIWVMSRTRGLSVGEKLNCNILESVMSHTHYHLQ